MAAVVLATATLAAGCYARVAGPAAYVSDDVVVTSAPVQVETYPYVVYDGAPVYYVEGRWYRRYGNGWTVYRNEPGYLQTRRPTYAPPAYRHNAPPAYGPSYGPTYAPPAHRTNAPPAHRR